MQLNIDCSLISENYQSKPSIAKLIIDRSLEKINDSNRKNVITDIFSVHEKYTNKQTFLDRRPKSRQEGKKTVIGRPKLDSINIDELYKSFSTRFDFIIDNDDSTGVINGVRLGLIKFNPKPNLISKTVTDAFINHTAGKIYVNLDNYEIVRIEGGVNSHFITTWRAWWAPISFDIDVYEFDFLIDYTTFNKMVIEKNLDAMVDYEIRNRGIDKYVYTLSNHRMKN